MPNRGNEIVKQNMRRSRWFVPAVTVHELAHKLAIRAQSVDGKGEPDPVVVEQIHDTLTSLLQRGEIKPCKRAGGSGFRKVSKREADNIVRRRGIPSRKTKPVKRQPTRTRKRTVATALAS